MHLPRFASSYEGSQRFSCGVKPHLKQTLSEYCMEIRRIESSIELSSSLHKA
jgi:hypothetical protein